MLRNMLSGQRALGGGSGNQLGWSHFGGVPAADLGAKPKKEHHPDHRNNKSRWAIVKHSARYKAPLVAVTAVVAGTGVAFLGHRKVAVPVTLISLGGMMMGARSKTKRNIGMVMSGVGIVQGVVNLIEAIRGRSRAPVAEERPSGQGPRP